MMLRTCSTSKIIGSIKLSGILITTLLRDKVGSGRVRKFKTNIPCFFQMRPSESLKKDALIPSAGRIWLHSRSSKNVSKYCCIPLLTPPLIPHALRISSLASARLAPAPAEKQHCLRPSPIPLFCPGVATWSVALHSSLCVVPIKIAALGRTSARGVCPARGRWWSAVAG